MSIPLRVKDALYQEAEAEGALMNRSAAKQVEFWAELGRKMAHSVGSADMLALMQGIARIRIEIPEAAVIDPQQVFAEVDKARQAGNLGQKITRGGLYYEASSAHPGLLDEVRLDGSRRSGRFIDGEFVAE